MSSLPLVPEVERIEQWNLVLLNRCNLHCITCSYPDQTPIRSIRRATIQRLLPQMLQYGVLRALVTGGEPVMHPEFDAIIADLHAAGLAITLVTNGTYLPQHFSALRNRLARCIISLDRDTAGLYRELRGADALPSLLELPARFRRESPETHLTFAVVVQCRNFRRLPAFLELGLRYGVDRVSFLAPDLLSFVNPEERGGATAGWTDSATCACKRRAQSTRDGRMLKDLIILALPWQRYDTTAIQLGTLQATLRTRGFSVDTRHYYKDLITYVSPGIYMRLFEASMGEPAFAAILFPSAIP